MAAVIDEKFARGPNFVFAKEYVIKTHGERVWNGILGKLPGLIADQWRGPLLASNSYSFQAFKDFTSELTKSIGSYTQKETTNMYEYIADRSLNALYKMFFRFSSPSFVLKNYPKLWGRFFNTGEVNVLTSEPKHAVIAFQLPEIFLDWIDNACYGYSKKAIEMAGGCELTLKIVNKVNIGNGQWNITYDLKWVE
jgi:hypothetical protein